MTPRAITRLQREALSRVRQNRETGLAMRLAIMGDAALWEIALQLATLNERLTRRQSDESRRKGRKP